MRLEKLWWKVEKCPIESSVEPHQHLKTNQCHWTEIFISFVKYTSSHTNKNHNDTQDKECEVEGIEEALIWVIIVVILVIIIRADDSINYTSIALLFH